MKIKCYHYFSTLQVYVRSDPDSTMIMLIKLRWQTKLLNTPSGESSDLQLNKSCMIDIKLYLFMFIGCRVRMRDRTYLHNQTIKYTFTNTFYIQRLFNEQLLK